MLESLRRGAWLPALHLPPRSPKRNHLPNKKLDDRFSHRSARPPTYGALTFIMIIDCVVFQFGRRVEVNVDRHFPGAVREASDRCAKKLAIQSSSRRAMLTSCCSKLARACATSTWIGKGCATPERHVLLLARPSAPRGESSLSVFFCDLRLPACCPKPAVFPFGCS